MSKQLLGEVDAIKTKIPFERANSILFEILKIEK